MREIKFRAWHKALGRCLTDIEMNAYEAPFINGELCFPTNVELMQYTGLKDKNGKEIYEGDVLKFRKDTFRVIWLKAFGHWDSSYIVKESKITHLFPHEWNNAEVIGNIYESKDLLKEGKDAEVSSTVADGGQNRD